MAQLKKIENTMSDHPELKKLLESVNLDDLFDDENKKEDEKSKKEKGNKN